MIKKLILLICLMLIPAFLSGQDTTKYISPYILSSGDTLSVDTLYVIRDKVPKVLIKKENKYIEPSWYDASLLFDPWEEKQNKNIKEFFYILGAFVFCNTMKGIIY